MTRPDDPEGVPATGADDRSTPGARDGPARGRGDGPALGSGERHDRLPEDPVWRKVVLAAHDAAVEAGRDGYIDPVTGLFVMTAGYLRARGTCCGSSCRHCPYGTRP